MNEIGYYSCENGGEIIRWIEAIVEFLRPLCFLREVHMVNFFKDRLWETLDPQWIQCLSNEPIHILLQIPSGLIKDEWPVSLKSFLFTLKSLLFPRHQQLQSVFPDLTVPSLNTVLSQGMNPKKKHEVQLLAALVSSVAKSLGPHQIIDVGSGQGYLSQVLAFHYHHSVLAIDASSHHGKVTDARAQRIHKHYASQMRKSNKERSLVVPKTVTCNVMSIDMLSDLACSARHDDVTKHGEEQTSTVLAGLHACGDLSVMMLKAFLASKQVKAVVSIGCCYNLLSEEGIDKVDSQYGFPVSHSIKSTGFSLGKSLRDLACQSAERWNCLETEAGIDNFELHAFRAAFQMILNKYYPEVMITSPSIGRQGKALRRLQKREVVESLPSKMQGHYPSPHDTDLKTDGSRKGSECDRLKLFKRYCDSGLGQLGLKPLQDIDYFTTWKEVEPFSELIGPYWSLRAALGPLIETLILLDRLLLLKEQGDSIDAFMLSLFDPAISPRNVAIIARKID